MKKLFFFLVALFVSASSFAFEAGKPDLVIDNFFFVKDHLFRDKAVVVVGNVGSRSILSEKITVRLIRGKDTTDFSYPYGMMPTQSIGIFSSQVFVPDSSATYKVIVDPENTIDESKEFNNEFSRKLSDPVFRITPNKYYNDTLFVLPGQNFYEDLGKIWEVDGKKIIIGLKTNISCSLFQTVDNLSYSFASLPDGDMNGGNFTVSQKEFWECTWVANSSTNVSSNLYLGAVQGIASKNANGDIAKVNVDLEIATSEFETYYSSTTKFIKKVDRIYGDVNGNDIVDKDDVEKVKRCLDEGTTIPANIYRADGDRIEAASILFGNGVSLLDYSLIWMSYKNPTDPLPLSAGVGSWMSNDYSVIKVSNTSTVSEGQISVLSDEGEHYNIVAAIDSNKVFRASGSMNAGETVVVSIPDKNLDYSVETIRFKDQKVSTALRQILKGNLSSEISILNTKNELVFSAEVNGIVKIFDVSGKILYKDNSFAGKTIDISILKDGLYLLKIGNRTFKFVK